MKQRLDEKVFYSGIIYEQKYNSTYSWKPLFDVQKIKPGIKVKDIKTNNDMMAQEQQNIHGYNKNDYLQTSSSFEITNTLTSIGFSLYKQFMTIFQYSC